MDLRRRIRFVSAQPAWMLASVLLLAFLGPFMNELVFVDSLRDLIVVALTASVSVAPVWRRRLQCILVRSRFGFIEQEVQQCIRLLPAEVNAQDARSSTVVLVPCRGRNP